MRYDPATYLPDPKLRARAAALDASAQAALAEALCANMATHVVYAVRAEDAPHAPDPMAADAVPVARELPGEEIAKAIRPDGTLPFVFDGLDVPVPVPRLARPILQLIDGSRSVGEIQRVLAARGTSADSFHRAWRATFHALERVNRILLTPPP